MDLSDIRKLVRLMKSAELSELEIDDSNQGLRVHLKRSLEGEGPVQPVVQVMGGAVPAPVAMSRPGAEPGAFGGSTPEAAPAGLPADVVVFESPMVGTFYRASSPDSDPFVQIDSVVDEASTICIVEAMKVMNEIKSELSGKIVEILVENGEPVEYGQPLFHIQKR